MATETMNGASLSQKLAGLEWRCVGPHRGGRVVAVAGDPVEPMTFYFGACAGGVWKTTDGGNYWECVSDGFFKTAAVGAIAVAASDPNVIYVGTGETTIRGNVSHGDGVYKSTDGGKSWTNVGLQDTRHIAKIRVHPQNPDLVYVAALGHAFGPNQERGVYRSSDGGKTWKQILFRSEKAGACDLSMDPNNPRILYAAIWQAQRFPYKLESGGPDSGLFKSTDGGDTWEELTRNPGLPKGVIGKIGVAVSPAKKDRVWALVEAEDGALFRSDDGGDTWQRLSEEGGLRTRAWYYMHIYADPQDPDTCWVLNMPCWKSIDGGKTFSQVPTPHGDNHDLWIDPQNPLRMIEGNDGGACVTFNGARSWSTLMNQPTAQMYHVTTDTRDPYRIYGSQQDNSALSIASFSQYGAIGQPDWYMPGGGESGYIAIRPDNPNIVFGGAIGSGWGNGRLIKYDHSVQSWQVITVWPDVTGMGTGAVDLKYRFQWTFPIVISPHDPNVLYVAGNRLFRSTDEGMSWEVISDDLTRNDPEKLQASGGPITRDNTGAEVYCTIFSFVESPHEKGVFWAGTDDGLVHISRDGGQTWANVTPPDLPEWALISIIEQSPHDPATAYLAATRYKWDDPTPYLYKTNDYGQSWRRITDGIPPHDFTRVVREDPGCRGVLYAGTETGIYFSLDDGQSWHRFGGNLPAVPIHDLVIKGTDMIVATHGRSFWVLDDLTPLHRLKEQSGLDGVRLFEPRETVRRWSYEFWWGEPTEAIDYTWGNGVVVAFKRRVKPDGTVSTTMIDAGKNPPDGAVITYYLPDKPEGDISLTFLTEDGQEIHSYSSKKEKKKDDEKPAEPEATTEGEGAEGPGPQAEEEEKAEEKEPVISKDAGVNRFVWNLRYADPKKIPEDKSVEYGMAGPRVLPGRYQVRLTVGDETQTQTLNLVQDPRVTVSEADLKEGFDFLKLLMDKVDEIHRAVIQIRDLKGQIDGWEKRLKGQENAEPILKLAGDVKKELTAVEEALIQPKADSPLQFPMKLNAKLVALSETVDYIDTRPPQQAREVGNELIGAANAQLEKFQEIVKSNLAELNRSIAEAQLPIIGAQPVK